MLEGQQGNYRARRWVDVAALRAGEPAVQDAFGAGYGHDAKFPQPDAGAFGSGGTADLMTPCSVLAELTGQALEAGIDRLTDDELIGVLRAARRVASWQTAVELAAVGELAARRIAEPNLSTAGPRPAERAEAELAVGLTLTAGQAGDLLSLAQFLEELPEVADALSRGHIDVAKAKVFAAELAGLSWKSALRIAARLLLDAADLTTGQLRARLRMAVLAVDPDALARRNRAARDHARVEAWDEGSGNAGLAGRELPASRALLADRHLTGLARSLMAAGLPGTLDQVRAAVFLALLTGQDPADLLAEAGVQDRTTSAAQDHEGAQAGTATGQDDDLASYADAVAAAGASDACSAAVPAVSWPAGPTGTVHLTMPYDTWVGLASRPGMVAGHGASDAHTCRDLADTLACQAGTRYCLTVITPDGRPLGHACSPRPPARASPSDWVSQLKIEWLAAGTCDHPRESAGYRPGRLLDHLIKVRNPTCTAPGCRRPAHRSDADHVIPYDKGGRTCECNLHPPCRRHHRLKGSSGWQLRMTGPGTLTWTLPHGRTYTTAAEPYPV